MHLRDSVANDLIADFVNGVNLKYYLDEAVSKTGKAIITGRKEFDSIDVKNWKVVDSLNGRIISVLLDATMPLDAEFLKFNGEFDQTLFYILFFRSN